LKKDLTSYLEGKLVFELGGEYTKKIVVDNVNNQSIQDIQNWAQKTLQEEPETFVEFGEPTLFVRRRYLMKDFNTKWERIEFETLPTEN
jgi:hypothetical protein